MTTPSLKDVLTDVPLDVERLDAIRQRHEDARTYDLRSTDETKLSIESLGEDYIQASLDRQQLLFLYDALYEAAHRLTHSSGAGGYLAAFNDLAALTASARRKLAPETESEKRFAAGDR